MLYPSNYQYLVDLLSYVAVGARSVENQEHRLVSSGISVPVGMKNPTAGSTTVMLNSIYAAQAHQSFIFRNWEVECDGNPLAHAVMRGYIGLDGRTYPNYHYEHLERLAERYTEHAGYANPAAVIDCNHDNSGKRPLEQHRICKEVLDSCRRNESISKLVKGFMIESYLEDGNQSVDGGVFGKSITTRAWAGKRPTTSSTRSQNGFSYAVLPNAVTGRRCKPARAAICLSASTA